MTAKKPAKAKPKGKSLTEGQTFEPKKPEKARTKEGLDAAQVKAVLMAAAPASG